MDGSRLQTRMDRTGTGKLFLKVPVELMGKTKDQRWDTTWAMGSSWF